MISKLNKKRVYNDRIENMADTDCERPSKLRKGEETIRYMNHMLQMC